MRAHHETRGHLYFKFYLQFSTNFVPNLLDNENAT